MKLTKGDIKEVENIIGKMITFAKFNKPHARMNIDAQEVEFLLKYMEYLEEESEGYMKTLDKVIDEYADLYDSFVANGSDDFPYFNKEEYKEYLLND